MATEERREAARQAAIRVLELWDAGGEIESFQEALGDLVQHSGADFDLHGLREVAQANLDAISAPGDGDDVVQRIDDTSADLADAIDAVWPGLGVDGQG